MNTNIENVLITSDGIRNSLKRYKPLQALSEYVWNGFDANATNINIEIFENDLHGIEKIIVADNGTGIEKESLKLKFRPFFQSEKVYDPELRRSAIHGKNGVGRLTFFAFANLAEWQTVYKKDENNLAYNIEINASTLQNYVPSNESKTDKSLGTIVTFTDIHTTEISCDTAKLHLVHEFCWFLELNKERNFYIYINGEPLDYSSQIVSEEVVDYHKDDENIHFEVKYVCWKNKLSDYSKYYYIKSDNKEATKENTTLNNKGDRFYHSVFIKSEIFDNFDFTNMTLDQESMENSYNKKSSAYLYIMHEVNCHLYDIRRPFLKKSVSKAIDNLEIQSAFPNYDSNNLIDRYKKEQIEEIVSTLYIAQPRLFTTSMNKEQKKTFIRLLDLIMESGEVDSLFNILNEILDMDELERKDLSDILKYTKMSNITKTINLIKDRYLAVNDFKQMLFNRELNANEVVHIQKFIEQHYWLFGEQYNLVTAAEPNFEEALRRHLKYLHKEYDDASIDHKDKLKQMDIFAVRQDVANKKYNNIVVELKHPTILLGEKQLSQVKKYMSVILSTEYFNTENMTWEFYLVGNRFSPDGFIEGELENNRNHGEPHLVYKLKQYKIYAMRWSEVFANFEMRHSYLNEKLQLEQNKIQRDFTTANQILKMQPANSATFPAEMAHT